MPQAASPVDRLHDQFVELLALLDAAGEVSLRSVTDGEFRKILLLAAASFFERHLTENIVDFVGEVTSNNHTVKWLVKKKAVERQYHTWFDWKARNANSFFKLFGDSFSEHMTTIITEREDLSSAIQAFMEIGRERNRLVHQDFGSFVLEKTSEEIYNLYRVALTFVEWFPQELRTFSGTEASGAAVAARST